MAYSPLEDRYLSALTAVQFPDTPVEPDTPAEQPTMLAAGPSSTATDALPGYGLRPDGTKKGNGWLGPLKMKDGSVMTELTMGVNIDGMETDIPTIVPTLSKQEIDHLLSGKPATDAIVDKAVSHAKMRMAQGFSPYADTHATTTNVDVRGRSQLTIGDAAMGLSDIGAATLKGAVQGYVGLPGDLEGVARLIINAMGGTVKEGTALPTTEEVKKWLDDNVGKVGDGKNPYETIGEFLAPGAYVQPVKSVGAATKAAIKGVK